MRKTRIAIYGDVNLNIIDGSSVWVKNVSRLSADADRTEVDVYSKAAIHRPELTDELRAFSNLRILTPIDSAQGGVASVKQVVDMLASEDLALPYDVVLVRGLAAAETFGARELLQGKLWLYLTDIPQAIRDTDSSVIARVKSLSERCRYLLCQTEELRNFLETRIGVSGRKLLLLPPLVPDSGFREDDPEPRGERPLRLVYSGKFAPLWGLNEQLDAFENRLQAGRFMEFHVIGDKFHTDPRNPLFISDLQERLRARGVIWHGGVPQETVFRLQERCDLGMAFRSAEMNTSLELSTKLLEYGASGIGAIVNPTPMHRRALGDDYPFFANDTADVVRCLENAEAQPSLLSLAASRTRALAEQHRMSRFQATWNRYLARMAHPPSLTAAGKPRRIVLAGHDLKFCKELIEYLESRKDVELRIDKWKSLREHDETQSRRLLDWADTVICEWCAGNAVWYSHNMNAQRQRLFVRLHRFETITEFPAKVNIANVEKVIFVGQHILDEAAAKFDWPRDKLAVVPNFVDTLVYDRPKHQGCEFNLGFIGYVPMLKRLDRAIDILEALLAEDSRYCLFVKGRHPWEYPWIWRKEEERNHYETIFRRLRENPELRQRVVFDGFGDDIPAWLRKIGYILSTSDLESFHMAAAEGMASGARAIFMDREGVRDVFQEENVFASASDCARQIRRIDSLDPDVIESNKRFIERYSRDAVSALYDELIF